VRAVDKALSRHKAVDKFLATGHLSTGAQPFQNLLSNRPSVNPGAAHMLWRAASPCQAWLKQACPQKKACSTNTTSLLKS
jgi:hypothetical protein